MQRIFCVDLSDGFSSATSSLVRYSNCVKFVFQLISELYSQQEQFAVWQFLSLISAKKFSDCGTNKSMDNTNNGDECANLYSSCCTKGATPFKVPCTDHSSRKFKFRCVVEVFRKVLCSCSRDLDTSISCFQVKKEILGSIRVSEVRGCGNLFITLLCECIVSFQAEGNSVDWILCILCENYQVNLSLNEP